MTLDQEFETAVRSHLATLVDRFDKELRVLLDTTDPEDSSLILFEYDSPHFADDFAVVMHFLRGPYDPVWSDNLLSNTYLVAPEVYEDPRYEPINPWGRASAILEDWLIERWKPHHRYPLPAYAGHHDSNFCKRLSDGKEMMWDDVKF